MAPDEYGEAFRTHEPRVVSRSTVRVLQDAGEPIPVTVVDFEMSFGAMVRFMVKFALASIPAAIILMIVGAILFAFAAAFLR